MRVRGKPFRVSLVPRPRVSPPPLTAPLPSYLALAGSSAARSGLARTFLAKASDNADARVAEMQAEAMAESLVGSGGGEVAPSGGKGKGKGKGKDKDGSVDSARVGGAKGKGKGKGKRKGGRGGKGKFKSAGAAIMATQTPVG